MPNEDRRREGEGVTSMRFMAACGDFLTGHGMRRAPWAIWLLLALLLVVAPAALASYAADVVADGSSSYWRLGEQSGATALDETSAGSNGSYQNGVILGTPGAVDDANTGVTLDGSNDYVRMPNTSALNPTAGLTLEAWMKPSAGTFGSTKTLLAKVLRSYLHGRGLLSMDTGGSTSYFHRDAIGSVTNLTSATGSTQWSYSYEPFGTARTEVQNDPAAPTNPFRFGGEQLDPSGLYHLRARQYDTVTGRFLATDPMTPSASEPAISSYVYAENLPTALIDPSGWGAVWGDDTGGEGCGGFWNELRCLKNWYVQEQLGWRDGCLRSTSCMLKAEATTIASFFPGGRVTTEAGPSLFSRITSRLADETGSFNPAARRFTADQAALVQLATGAKRQGGLTADEGSILREWADEYGLPSRGPEAHPGRGFGSNLHYHIGPVNHIPAR